MSSRRNKTSGLSGFVSFMKRRDAEEALRELDGFDWGGSVLRVGWSKAVPVGARAMYSKILLYFEFRHITDRPLIFLSQSRGRRPTTFQVPVEISR
jgi:RNA recognition motif-containing protein